MYTLWLEYRAVNYKVVGSNPYLLILLGLQVRLSFTHLVPLTQVKTNGGGNMSIPWKQNSFVQEQ